MDFNITPSFNITLPQPSFINPQCFISLPHAKFPIPLKPSFNMLISHPALHRPPVFTPFPQPALLTAPGALDL